LNIRSAFAPCHIRVRVALNAECHIAYQSTLVT